MTLSIPFLIFSRNSGVVITSFIDTVTGEYERKYSFVTRWRDDIILLVFSDPYKLNRYRTKTCLIDAPVNDPNIKMPLIILTQNSSKVKSSGRKFSIYSLWVNCGLLGTFQ